jgi:protoporphyrinogen oxidase
VTAVDPASRTVLLADASSRPYDTLITTVPLDLFCGLCGGLESDVHHAASRLLHSATHVLGLGLKGGFPDSLRTKCWMYFPEGHSPYYRVTVFSNYSPNNVPEGGGYWSLMAEVCETGAKPVRADRLWGWAIEALRRDELIAPQTEIVSLWHKRIEHGYPTPFLQRDEVLGRILPRLEEARIFSRGRFGAWKYEVSNQDHSFMQGVELAERLLGNGEEVTLNAPDYVNSGALLGSAARRPDVAVGRHADPPAEGAG